MDNRYKLILIVLSFFLFISLIQEKVAIEPQVISFASGSPAVVKFQLTNPADFSALPELHWNGPFTVEEISGLTNMAPNETIEFTATLQSSSSLRIGDVYSGLLRSNWGELSQEIPLRVTKSPAAIWNAAGLTGLLVLPSIDISTFDVSNMVNGILILIVLVLALALLFRVKHRLEGK